MSEPVPLPPVRDVPEEHRLVLELDGEVAELVYAADDRRLVLVHTGVPEVLGGKGIGGELVRAAVQRAAAEGLAVVPRCPFARDWLVKHPEVAATVTVH